MIETKLTEDEKMRGFCQKLKETDHNKFLEFLKRKNQLRYDKAIRKWREEFKL